MNDKNQNSRKNNLGAIALASTATLATSEAIYEAKKENTGKGALDGFKKSISAPRNWVSLAAGMTISYGGIWTTEKQRYRHCVN